MEQLRNAQFKVDNDTYPMAHGVGTFANTEGRLVLEENLVAFGDLDGDGVKDAARDEQLSR